MVVGVYITRGLGYVDGKHSLQVIALDLAQSATVKVSAIKVDGYYRE